MQQQDQNTTKRSFYSEFFKLVQNMYKQKEITNEEKLFLKKKAIQQDSPFQKFFDKPIQIDEIEKTIQILLHNENINKITSSDYVQDTKQFTNQVLIIYNNQKFLFIKLIQIQRKSSYVNSGLYISQIYKNEDEINNSQLSIMDFFKIDQRSSFTLENNLNVSRFKKRNSDDEEKVLKHLLQQSFSQIKL